MKQKHEIKFRVAVRELSNRLDELAEAWIVEGINFDTPVTDKRFSTVSEITNKFPKSVIAYVMTYMIVLDRMKTSAATLASGLAIDEMQNRARFQGALPKKAKAEKAQLVLANWEDLSSRGKSKTEAAKIITKRLEEKGIRAKSTSIMRMLREGKLQELKKRYPSKLI